MTDFETRLTEALTSGAEQAPDPDGLAAGARRRSRTRHRVRVGIGVGVAVAALAVPVGVLAVDDGGTAEGTVANDPADRNAEWQTIEHEGVLVDVPGAWVRLDTSSCVGDDTRYGPRGSDPCAFDHDGVGFYRSADIDPYRPPGVFADRDAGWTGYVPIGDRVVNVHSDDRDRARRILGSAREEGQVAPDLSAGFTTESYDGLSIDVPANWQEGALSAWCTDKKVPGRVEFPNTRALLIRCSPRTGYGIRFDPSASAAGSGFTEQHGPRYPENSWAGVAIVPDENGAPIGLVEVVAPNQGLAELIGGSLRAE